MEKKKILVLILSLLLFSGCSGVIEDFLGTTELVEAPTPTTPDTPLPPARIDVSISSGVFAGSGGGTSIHARTQYNQYGLTASGTASMRVSISAKQLTQ